MVGIFGFMYYWDLIFSFVIMIYFVMSVGFLVDFVVYICYLFLFLRLESEVFKFVFDKFGGLVFNVVFLFLFGIVMLFFFESYIF